MTTFEVVRSITVEDDAVREVARDVIDFINNKNYIIDVDDRNKVFENESLGAFDADTTDLLKAYLTSKGIAF